MANEEGFPQIPERVAKSLEERTVRFTKEQLVPRSKVPCLNLPDLREIAAYGLPDTEAYLLIECEPSERMTVCPCCKRSGGLVGNGYTESPRLVHDVNVGVRQVDLSVRVPKYRCKFCEATPNHEYENDPSNHAILYIDWGYHGRTLLHSGKYIKYPKNSNCQSWMKKQTSRRIRSCRDVPVKGNYYRRLFDYWWTLY